MEDYDADFERFRKELRKMGPDELYRSLIQHYENEHKRKILKKVGATVLCFLGFFATVIYVSNKIDNDRQSGKQH